MGIFDCCFKGPQNDVDLQQIRVHPEGLQGPIHITFDNNNASNYWSYHPGTDIDNPHITELFEIKPVGGNMVEVIGLRPPNGSKWFLTVHEDPAGVPERFPRFRPEQHIDANDPSQHIEFTLGETTAGDIALSFHTTQGRGSQTVYFVPTADEQHRIETKLTPAAGPAEYAFRRGPKIN